MDSPKQSPEDLKAELQSLREEVAGYRAVVDNSPDFIMRYDRELRHVYANQTILDATGIAIEDAIGKTHRELGYPLHLCELWEGAFRQVFATGEPTRVDFEGDVPGATLYLELRITPERDQDGCVTHVLAVSRDITERRRAELALAASEAKYRGLVETSHDLIWMRDAEGRFIYLNPAWEQVLGYPLEEISGQMAADLAQPKRVATEAEAMRTVLAGGPAVAYDTIYLSRTGSEVHLGFKAVARHGQDGQIVGTQGTAFDLTERKSAEQACLKLEQQLHHARKLESLGVLAGGVAHDFNNLLVGILGSADLALLELPQGSPPRADVEEIATSAKRCARLAHQMLAYSGKGQFVIEPVDLRELVNGLHGIVRSNATQNTELVLRIPEGLPTLKADPTRLRQLVVNLLINASEALGGQSGRVVATAHEDWCTMDCPCRETIPGGAKWSEGPVVALEISDTGHGMDEETRARIFDPFYSTKFTGRGLGLSVVHGVARGHEAGIAVQSCVGEGTTFIVHFRNLSEREAQPVREAPVGKWRGSGTVLLVDDEPVVLNVGGRLLEYLGFNVVTASDGPEALDVFEANRDDIDCILLDWTMPQMSGADVFVAVRSLKTVVPIVVTSGFSEEEVWGHLEGLGAAGFIQKPYGLDGLRSVLRPILESEADLRDGVARN